MVLSKHQELLWPPRTPGGLILSCLSPKKRENCKGEREKEWGEKKRFCMTLFSQRLFPTPSMPRGVTVEAGYLPCAITTFKGLIFNTQHIITVGCGKSTSAKNVYLAVVQITFLWLAFNKRVKQFEAQNKLSMKKVPVSKSLKSCNTKNERKKNVSRDMSFTYKITSKRPFK